MRYVCVSLSWQASTPSTTRTVYSPTCTTVLTASLENWLMRSSRQLARSTLTTMSTGFWETCALAGKKACVFIKRLIFKAWSDGCSRLPAGQLTHGPQWPKEKIIKRRPLCVAGVWLTDLVHVATHEIGHVLGLMHSMDSKAIMHLNATLTGRKRITQDEVWGLHRLYGTCAISNSSTENTKAFFFFCLVFSSKPLTTL